MRGLLTLPLGLGLLSLVGVHARAQDARSSVDRGAALFHESGCEHCHGPAGVGGGEGPDLQLVRKRLSEAAIVRQIHDGGSEMPPFGDQLNGDQIADLVHFLLKPRKVVKTH